MKKSVDILDLPVISVTEGKEIGKVKDLVINPAGGYIAGVVVDDGKWYLGAKLLPFASIMGIGEYALTIQNSENIASVTARPDLEQLLEADIKVIGTKVLTNTGRIQGKVLEIVFDETGKITVCEIEETDGGQNQISASRILTYAKEVIIVNEADETAQQTAPTIPAQPLQQAAASAPAETASDDSGKKFDEKHRKYMLGKKAGRRIETDNGVLIVEQGGEITEEVLQKAKLAGKFVELSMNIQ